MSTYLYRLGRFAVRRRWLVLVSWVLALIVLTVSGRAAGGELHDEFNIPGVESQQALNVLQATFPAQAGARAQVVFHAPEGALADPANAAAVAATFAKIDALPHVVGSVDPVAATAKGASGVVSKDGTIGLGTVQYDQSAIDLGKANYEKLQDATASATKAGLDVSFGGDMANTNERTAPGSEGLGLLAAMVILVIAFGSIIAMGLSIGTALFGLGSGMALMLFVSSFVSIPTVAETIAVMIGLGVGIDYALFIVTRHRAGLARGLTVADAAGRAIATAGQAVIIAAFTVVIAICGLAVAGIPMVSWMGYGAAIVVAVTAAAAVTLLPALMGFAGHNVDRFGIPGMKPKVETGALDEHGNYHGWARWSHHVSKHSVRYLVLSLAAVLLLAVPFLSLRLGMPDNGNKPTTSTLRQSYDLIAEGFGPGSNGPLILSVELGGADAKTFLPELSSQLAATDGVAAVAPATLSPNGDTAVIQVIPTTSPQDEKTSTLIHTLRDDVVPPVVKGTGAHVYVGGNTATFIDMSDKIASRLPFFIGAVILVSFLLLMIVFRSILVPLKAAIMNVLSIGAAYGVIVAIFQWGWGAGLFGVHEALPIVAFVPMLMFAILFGLSMDYEVFLLSRVREEYLKDGDNTESVATGIATTARVITSAALIMISVFLSFVLGDDPTIKMVGIGLATAIFVDATLIRMVLVPSTMSLLGDANWWFPKWLDRIVPNLDIEGESRLPADELEADLTLEGDGGDDVPDGDRELQPV
ncbi:MMPL family transporter [Aquihabitans sp. McL0605]|uniref:MMPL family transporter n=1 Tax=Aquihabitans sp. McL0605 TaxID=3415671 RepID=UPI003CECE9BB